MKSQLLAPACRLSALMILGTLVPTAGAVSFNELNLGDPIHDAVIDFGAYKLQLPSANWTVLSKYSSDPVQSLGSMMLAIPVRQLLVGALRDDVAVTSMWLSTLERDIPVSRWDADPCADNKARQARYAFHDDLDGRLFMPECLSITKVHPQKNMGFSNAWALARTQLESMGARFPETVQRGYYNKYVVGNYFLLSVTAQGTTDPAAFQAWMRKVAETTSASLKGDRRIVIPPLP